MCSGSGTRMLGEMGFLGDGVWLWGDVDHSARSGRFRSDLARLAPSLAAALKDHTAAFGTTARTGGWRSNVMTPRKAAAAIAEHCRDAGNEASVALVFGPEDRGERARVEAKGIAFEAVPAAAVRGKGPLSLA